MLKVFIENLPPLVFFVVYKIYGDLIFATAIMLIFSIPSLLYLYIIEGIIPKMSLTSTILLTFFAGLSYISGDLKYIKMKPTIVNIIFAALLLYGILIKKEGFVKYLLNWVFEMPEHAWLTLSKRFVYYFFSLAMLNEFVWRNYSEATWVNFKLFGLFGITIAFTALQFRFIAANSTQKL